MAQRTLVLKVPKNGHAALQSRFGGGTFEFRRVPHAVFSVKGEGTVATLYSSGKLVVQGEDPEGFVARFTDLELPDAPMPAAPGDDEVSRVDGPLVGADETGKGDYFGPLVVAAVRIVPRQARELAELGIADSKTLDDARSLKLGAWLRHTVEYAVRRLDPPEYNEKYPSYAGLNPMLADLHAEAIRAVARPGDRVLVDQFAAERVMQKALGKLDVELVQATRAERNVAVAAASVLARAEFLVRLHELSSEWDVELHKGAGSPVDAAGARFVTEHGFDKLEEVAKVHFKNTQKIEKRMRGRRGGEK